MKMFNAVVLGIGALVPGLVYAYEYTFFNQSDTEAEVHFKLAADIVAGSPYQTIKVPAKNNAAISIPEWWRAGLCIDLYSIEIKFLPDGEFKKPLPIDNNDDFTYVVQTKKSPNKWAFLDKNNQRVLPSPEQYVKIFPLESSWYKDGQMISLLCFNRTFDFAYHETNKHPVIRVR